MSPSALPQLQAWTRHLDAGETLFREGDEDHKLYYLLEGRVEILQQGARIAEVDHAESFIGEIAALTGDPRSATVRTLTPSIVVVIPSIEELFARSPETAQSLAAVLAKRLRRIEKQLRGLCDKETDDRTETVRELTAIVRSLTVAIDPDRTLDLP